MTMYRICALVLLFLGICGYITYPGAYGLVLFYGNAAVAGLLLHVGWIRIAEDRDQLRGG